MTGVPVSGGPSTDVEGRDPFNSAQGYPEAVEG